MKIKEKLQFTNEKPYQSIMLSATLNDDIINLASELLKNPKYFYIIIFRTVTVNSDLSSNVFIIYLIVFITRTINTTCCLCSCKI